MEDLTPDNVPDHSDLIEGQGSLFHVSSPGVILALIHRGQPDALGIRHEPARSHVHGRPGCKLPTIEAVCDMAVTLARVASPTRQAVGVSINTQHLSDAEARLGLPTVDPFRHSAGRLVDALESDGSTPGWSWPSRSASRGKCAMGVASVGRLRYGLREAGKGSTWKT